MAQERKMNNELIAILKSEIAYLKGDVIHKNNLLEMLMQDKTSSLANPTIAPLINHNPFDDIPLNDNAQDFNSINNAENDESRLVDEVWHLESRQSKRPSKPIGKPNIQTRNRFQALSIIESDSDEWGYDENLSRNPISQGERHEKKRPPIVVNNNPESNHIRRTYPKHVPGNSTYADIAKQGSKTLILCDSICSRIKMKQFNSYLRNSTAYRKNFPGTNARELKHYCIYTLLEDCPDNVIISVGTNSLNKNTPQEIANDIFDIVDICHLYGAGRVYISSITYRKNFARDINNLNNLLFSNESVRDFKVIDNGAITNSEIWRDNIHLNDAGVDILANNFIDALNGVNTR